MKFTQLFILVLAFFMIKPAQAGLLIEPVVGYSMGKIEIDAPGNDEEKGNGLSWGGRLGYQELGFQLGLDYLRSSYNMKDNAFKEDLVASEWALFAGFEFPVLLRVYAGYIFSAQAETELAGSTTIKLNDGTGMKVGVGFTGLPFVDINLEYRKGTYTELKGLGGSSNIDTDFSAVMLGVSLPFVI